MTVNKMISQEYIDIIQKECKELIDLCLILNNSPSFQNKVNTVQRANNSAIPLKAEHIILQDIVNLYYRLEKADKNNTNSKSKFTLAYYYECLKRGNVIASSTVEKINNVVKTALFEDNFKKVVLSVSNNFNTTFISVILNDIESDHVKQMSHHIYKYAHSIAHSDGAITEAEKKILNELISRSESSLYYNNEIENDTLEKALNDLGQLIGLSEAKATVTNIINFLKIQKAREVEKLPKVSSSLHAVFIGPPGTGKTSVARILSRIYKHLGILEKGHLIETDRTGLVAGYVGQTSLKTDEVIKSALGGVLFIDEAYSLAEKNTAGNDYGKEALEVLLKRMEDYRDKFIVIVAGYPEEMRTFIESNPGLKSRFNQYLNFNHYSPQELVDIYKSFCSKYAFKLSAESEEKIADIFTMANEKKTNSYGNAREARNVFEQTIRLQADRLVNIKDINAEVLSEILEEDIPPVKETVQKIISYGALE